MTVAEQTMLTIEQLAERLQVSVASVRRRVEGGKLPPPVRIGHLARWRLNDIQQWEAKLLPGVGPSR